MLTSCQMHLPILDPQPAVVCVCVCVCAVSVLEATSSIMSRLSPPNPRDHLGDHLHLHLHAPMSINVINVHVVHLHLGPELDWRWVQHTHGMAQA